MLPSVSCSDSHMHDILVPLLSQLHNHGPASSRPKSTPITPSASEAVHWGAGPGSHRARGQTSGPGVARGGSSPHSRSNSTTPARGRVTPGGWELVGSAGDTGSDDVRSTGSADGPSPHQGDEVRREAMRQQAEAAHRRPRQLFHQASHKLFRVASGARVVQVADHTSYTPARPPALLLAVMLAAVG